jgi:hypothetical protein
VTTEKTVELPNLFLPAHLAQYIAIVALLFLWQIYAREAKPSHAVPIVQTPSIIQPRRAQRHPLILPVELSWDLNDAKGTTTNISVQGCRIKSEIAPTVGTYVSVKLRLQGQECIAIEMAVVRWALGQNFGLEFLSLAATERQRLEHFVESLPSKKPDSGTQREDSSQYSRLVK